MARHPAHVMVALTVRVPRGQQGFWEVMRRLHRERGEFTAAQVDGASNVDSGTVHDFIRRLVKGGWLQVVREEPTTGTPRRVYRLAKDQPDAPRLRRDGTPAVRVGRGQEQMWRAMKMLDRWSVRELVMTGTHRRLPRNPGNRQGLRQASAPLRLPQVPGRRPVAPEAQHEHRPAGAADPAHRLGIRSESSEGVRPGR